MRSYNPYAFGDVVPQGATKDNQVIWCVVTESAHVIHYLMMKGYRFGEHTTKDNKVQSGWVYDDTNSKGNR